MRSRMFFVAETTEFPPVAQPAFETRYSYGIRSATEWDAFAQRCAGTYQCSYGYIALLRLTHARQIFEFFVNDRKIGQCAVAVPRIGRGVRLFTDGIQLLPDLDFYWPLAMRAILDRLGPGRYRYGSVWSTIPSCLGELRRMPGITIIQDDLYQVQAVDFSKWPDWPGYHRALSSNAKRNAAKARKSDPDLRIMQVTGLKTLRYAGRMMLMRRATYRRKGAALDFLSASLRFLGRILFMRHYIFMTMIFFHGRLTAVVSGVRFGRHVYYLDGASVADNGGSSWYLLIDILRQTQTAYPTGMFVMGPDQAAFHIGRAGWDNLLRQREQCKASNFPTSLVTFDYGCIDTTSCVLSK